MNTKYSHIAYITLGAAILLALPQRSEAQDGPPSMHPKMEALATPRSNPNWLEFREGTRVNAATLFRDHKEAFKLGAGDSMVLQQKRMDNLKFSHFRYQQYHNNRKVVYGQYIVHEQPDGTVRTANGRLITGLNLPGQPSVNEQQALRSALQFMNAKRYLWENPAMERTLKQQQKNEQSTYFPKGELVFAPTKNENFTAADYRLAWHFKIYTDDPAVVAKSVYVDALSGKVINTVDIAMNCSGGSGGTAFNGTVSIYTSSASFLYRSHNNCQATDLYVYNCNGGGAANNFYFDADNNWSATSQQSGVQAIWGTQMTYNYFVNVHGRQSWNGGAADMITYNNAYAGSNNACWGCTGNSAIFYAGNTSASTDDWNTNDIVGHEFGHGVTQSEADLIYFNESGALNESFSDIFGEMVESWSEGNCDYLMGGDRGSPIRSLSNPNAYGHPDTYGGTNWYVGSWDNGGVHVNSGVQNRWFHLLSEGGSGNTDFGIPFSVTGIGRFKARQIAYRALTEYLVNTSQYIDARRATLQAAWDLYGQCSQEIIAVGDAWHAVGVESQSPAFAINACGNFPASGTFIQAISLLTAANGCATTISPSSSTVYFTARDRVVLYPGFHATAGSKFVAYLEPCSSTRWAQASAPIDDPSKVPMSDMERGIRPAVVTAVSPQPDRELTLEAGQGVTVLPNPFKATFDVTISAEKDGRAKVTLYNVLGEKIQEKQGVQLVKGVNRTTFNGSGLPSGVYLVEIIMDNVRQIKKITKL